MTHPSAGAAADVSTARSEFLQDVTSGLRAPRKHLPCKYFYDRRGSALFDDICRLDEYYPTRCESAIMDRYADEMGAQIGPGAMLVEYGSGSSVKTRYLLDALPDPAAYVPVDISGDHLLQTARELARDYPRIEILPVCADFTQDFDLPTPTRPATHAAVYFPGSTIGNFVPDQATALLRRIVSLCGDGGGLLIGIDLKKSPAVIQAAYDDAGGVTAAFNLNLLTRINRELGADFKLSRFAHRAVYDVARGRVEMHLVSRRSQTVCVGDQRFEFVEGETICTEYSHKYDVDEFAAIARRAGLALHREWTDEAQNFAVLHLAVVEAPPRRRPKPR